MEWNNAGVAPSAEKQQTGYAAGEKLPAGHLNWFISQLSKSLTTQSNLPAKIIYGAYTGNGAEDGTQTITLGFKPYALLLFSAQGTHSYGNESFTGGLVLDGYSLYSTQTETTKAVEITSNGFNITSTYFNKVNKKYYYIAFSAYPQEGA